MGRFGFAPANCYLFMLVSCSFYCMYLVLVLVCGGVEKSFLSGLDKKCINTTCLMLMLMPSSSWTFLTKRQTDSTFIKLFSSFLFWESGGELIIQSTYVGLEPCAFTLTLYL